jgi:hypothetical protein
MIILEFLEMSANHAGTPEESPQLGQTLIILSRSLTVIHLLGVKPGQIGDGLEGQQKSSTQRALSTRA